MAQNGFPISSKSVASGRGRHFARRHRLTLFTVGLLSTLVLVPVAVGQVLKDPLFGLSLPAAAVEFDPTDPALIARCNLGGAGSEQRSWIFASTQAPDGEYLVLGGLARTRRGDAMGPWIQDWKGELVRISGSDCTIIDPPREAMAYPAAAAVPLANAVVGGLAADAVSRFSHAFGSRKRFVTELRRQGVYPGPGSLRDAIEASTLP